MLGEEHGPHHHLINMLRSYYAVISTVRDRIFRTNYMNLARTKYDLGGARSDHPVE